MPSVTSPREQVLQAVRVWVKYCTGLTDAKVIVGGDANAIRPAMPYAVVTVLLPGVPVGTGEQVRTVATGTLYEAVVGDRRATVQVDLFGRTASDLVELLYASVDGTLAQAVLDTYGVAISRILSPRNGLDLRDTGYEERATVDVEVTYRLQTDAAAIVAAENLGWGITIDSTSPAGDLVVSGSEVLP